MEFFKLCPLAKAGGNLLKSRIFKFLKSSIFKTPRLTPTPLVLQLLSPLLLPCAPRKLEYNCGQDFGF
jgi:hypothetical protein